MGAIKSSRMEWVQVLRGVAASMVVLYHLGFSEAKLFGAQSITPVFVRAGEAGVDIFFVISGFIMVFITPQKLAGFFGWAEFLYRRITRIFPPYWVVSFALLLVWLRHPESFNNYYHNQVSLWRSFLLLPQSYLPLVNAGWSLIHEVYFYFIISGVLLFGTSGRKAWLGVWIAIVLYANFLGLTDAAHGSPMRQLIFSPFSLEFQMGALVALTYKEVAALKIPVGLYITSSLGGLMMIYAVGLFMEAGGVYPDNNHLARVLVYGLAALAMLFSIVQLDAAAVARPALKAPRWGVFLGDASYALYLVHIPIINTAYKLFAHVVPHPKFGVALIAFVMIAAIVFAGAILFHTTVERRMILFFHTLSTKLFNKPNVAGAG